MWDGRRNQVKPKIKGYQNKIANKCETKCKIKKNDYFEKKWIFSSGLKSNKTFNKRKNRALLTVRHSQKYYEILSNNVLRKNITRKQLRLETIMIA